MARRGESPRESQESIERALRSHQRRRQGSQLTWALVGIVLGAALATLVFFFLPDTAIVWVQDHSLRQ